MGLCGKAALDCPGTLASAMALLCRKSTHLPGSSREPRCAVILPGEGLLLPQPAGARRQTQALPDDSHAQSVRVSILSEDSFPGGLGFFFSVLSLTRNLKLEVEKHT